MTKPQRPPKRDINGILLLDKPTGLSSNDALQKVKRLFNAKKAGHTGALDPLATGMLPLCFGEGTKFSQFLLDSDKVYEVTLKLGVRTNTSDSEGEVVATKEVPHLSTKQVEKYLSQFRGELMQVPSMFSALKHQGKPLYFYARQGITIEREARPIHIFELTLLEQTADTLKLRVHCSKGTYVRTLVDDLGELIGCGAHVIALRRLQVSSFQEQDMVTLETLMSESPNVGTPECHLLPIESIFVDYPRVELTPEYAHYIRQGQAIFMPNLAADQYYALFNGKQFIGVGEIADDGKLKPKRLIVSSE